MLDKKLVEKVLKAALANGGDFAEIFLEDKDTARIVLVGGKIETDLSGKDYGVGIRIFDGLNSIYAYTNDSTEENLTSVAEKASKAIKGSKKDMVLDFNKTDVKNLNSFEKEFKKIAKEDKIALLREGYEAAKSYNDLISQVTVVYLEEEQDILVANTEGVFKTDKRARTRYTVQAVASKDGEKQSGAYSPGRSMGFEFYDTIDVKEVAREAARIATVAVNADNCPSGKMPVIIDNEFGGVLFHEACGHALEAEFVSKGLSSFGDKLGKKVASELVTAIDDGTIANAWGTMNIDDEGRETQKNILIENGILKSYLVDQLNGRRMDTESTGSGRRQSYKYAPTSRMNNTYIAAGESKLEDMIRTTDYGLYAKKLGGGSVNPATGEFNFAVMEGYIVKNGKIDRPVRGATLIGNGLEVLEKIDMVGDNLDLGQGMCGASSGSIPVNVGQPAIRVSELTVGGREESK